MMAAIGSNAANSNFAYTTYSVASNIFGMGMLTSNLKTGAAFSDMTDATPSNMTAYLLFRDPANNFSSASSNLFVKDLTPPTIESPLSFVQGASNCEFTPNNGK